MSVPHVPGRERDLWYTVYSEHKGAEVATGGWPRYEVVCEKWEENAAGERRLIESRSQWLDFDRKIRVVD